LTVHGCRNLFSMKLLFKIAAISLSSLLILVFAAVLFLTSSPGEGIIKGWIEDALSAQIGLPVSIDKFETNLWTRVEIDKLLVSPDSDSASTPVLYVGKVSAGYSLFQLLGDDITLKSLLIDSAAIGVTVDSLGRYGIPILDRPSEPPADTTGQGGSISIDSISLHRFGALYADRQMPLTVELAGTRLSAGCDREGVCSGRLTAVKLAAVYDSLALDIDDIDVSARFDGEMIRLERVHADCAGLQLEAQGTIGIAEPAGVELTATVEGPLDSLLSILAEGFDLPVTKAGHLSAQCRVEGSMSDPVVGLHADLDELVARDIAVSSALLRAEYHDQEIRLDSFLIAVFDGTISGKGSARIDSSGTFALNSTLEGVGLASVWQSLYSDNSPYRGTVSGQVEARGRLSDLSSLALEADVTGGDLHYLDRPVPDLDCSAQVESGRVIFSLTHGADTISADVVLAGDSLKGSYQVIVPDLTALARFFGQPELAGSLWIEGTVENTYTNPTAIAVVRGRGVSYRNFPIDTLRADLFYEDSLLTVIDFACAGQLDSIDPVRPPFDLDSLGGSLRYDGQARGRLDGLTGQFRASMTQPRYGSFLLDSVSALTTLDGPRLIITDLTAGYGRVAARLKAAYDTSSSIGSFSLRLLPVEVMPDSVDGQSQDSAELSREDFGTVEGEFKLGTDRIVSSTVVGQGLWLGLMPMLTGDTVITDGAIDFNLTADGPYLTPAGALRARVRALTVGDYVVDSVALHASLTGASLSLDSLVSYTLGQTLRATGRVGLGVSPDGTYELRDDAAITAELTADGIDLGILEGLFLAGGEITGSASAALHVGGTAASPRLSGWLRAEQGRLLLEGSTLPLEDIGVSLLFDDSVLTIERAGANVSGKTIAATGSLVTSDFKSASLTLLVDIGEFGKVSVEGTVVDTLAHVRILSDSLNLAVLQPMMTKVDSLAGRLGCRLLIVGPPAAPEIEGTLEIIGLSFLAPRHYAALSDGFANIRFDKNKVMLDSASAVLNGGKVAVSGAIEHDRGNLADINLSLKADSVSLREPDTYVTRIDSAVLSYGKQQENYVLEGDVVLGETRFTAGLRPTSILPWVQSLETVDLELPEIIARSRLDVRIRESNNLWVDNNLARLRLRAALGVIGTPLRPNFTGLVEVEEGYLIYLDRRFKVTTGSVYFNDPARFNPDINLDAGTEVTVYRRTAAESYKVYIKAEGLLDQLQYGLFSEPPLDKPDIVALLTLGATRSELAGSGDGNSQGGLTGVLKDRAAVLTSQRVSGYLSRRAGSLFGFDEFTIQGNLFKFDESWGPQLVASKRLSTRLNVTYSTTVGHLNDQTVRLGYRLTRGFMLQGETDRQGSAGLDLKYGFSFK